MSFFNGFLTSSLGFVCVCNGIDLWSKNSKFEELTCAFAVGYFLSDTLVLLSYRILSFQTAIHHLASLAWFVAAMYMGQGAGGPCAALIYGEISNANMHL